jgi:mycothiol synthase
MTSALVTPAATVPGVPAPDWRPLTAADTPALAALLAAAEAVDDTGADRSAADLAEEFTAPGFDPAAMTTGRFAGGELTAYAALHSPGPRPEPRKVWLNGAVHPAHRGRGLGHRLLDWSLATAPLIWPGPLNARVELMPGGADKERLFTAAGFTEARRFFDMECALPHPAEVVLPAGLRLAPYAECWDEPLRLVRNTAFAGHWGSIERDAAEWRALYTGTRKFRPELTFLLLDAADRIAAYLLSQRPGDGPALWITNVGTLPEHRGRGCATALLAHTLNAAPAHGYRTAGLGVDTGNSTGAVGVYLKAGFTVRREARLVTRDLP